MNERVPVRWLIAAGALLLACYEAVFGNFIPNAAGKLGHDYAYFLPRLLAGTYHWATNGFHLPWFTPFACGGLPSFPNPQDQWLSLTQLLALAVSPLAALHLNMLLFAATGLLGTYLLLRTGFRCSVPVALVGATVFLFNGFFGSRMAIGHLTAHGFMLLPMIVFLLTFTSSNLRMRVFCGVGAGCLSAYLLVTSAQFIPVFGLALVALCLLYVISTGRRAVYLNALLALCIATLLASAKLVAVASLFSHFPRTDYPLPGFASLPGLFETVLRGLFGWPSAERTHAFLVNARWGLGVHELDYGITLAPFVLLTGAWGTRLLRRADVSTAARAPSSSWFESLLLGLLLLLPIVLNFYAPAWNAALKRVPVLSSTSTYLRWLCLYIPILAVVVSLAVERARFGWQTRWVIWGLTSVGVIAQQGLAVTSFYEGEAYNPGELTAAEASLRATGRVPPVDRVVPVDPHSLIRGATTLACYEPLFGYRLERFPRGDLHPGPALRAGEAPNVKNPACYVYPEENGCEPGDHFRADQTALAEAFLRYEPFEFRMSTAQRIANMTSLVSLVVCCLLLLGALWGSLRRFRDAPGPAEPS